jgi:hypothetical protein
VAIETAAVPAQTDGDSAGMGPLTVRDAPQSIEIVVG